MMLCKQETKFAVSCLECGERLQVFEGTSLPVTFYEGQVSHKCKAQKTAIGIANKDSKTMQAEAQELAPLFRVRKEQIESLDRGLENVLNSFKSELEVFNEPSSDES